MPKRCLHIGRKAALLCAACVGSLPLAASAQPVSDSDFISIIQPQTGQKQIVIAGAQSDTTFAVAVMIDHATPLRSISIPLSFAGLDGLLIDTSIHETTNAPGITYGPSGSSPPWALRSALLDNENKTVLIGFVSYSTVQPAADTLCYIHFYLNSGARNLSIQLDTTLLPPHNRLFFVDPQANDCVPQYSPLTITVGSGNYPPVLAAIGSQYADANLRLTFPVSSTDPDGTVPVLSTSELPAGASFDDHGDGTGLFDWIPDAAQEGYHSVTFRASDGGIIDSEIVSILVTHTNRPPVLAPLEDRQFRVETRTGILVSATDPDGTIPALSAVGLPPDALFTDHGNGSGAFRWTPGWTDNGYYDFTFIASDGIFADSETVKVFIDKSGSYQTDSDLVEVVVPGTGAHDLYLPSVTQDTTFTLAVMVRNASTIRAIVVPLVFAGLDGLNIDASVMTPPDMVGVTYGPAGRGSLWHARTSNINNPKSILLGFLQYEQYAPHDDTLCYIHFTLSATTTPTVVPVDTAMLPPYNTLMLYAYDQGSHMELYPQWRGLTLHIGNMPPELIHPGSQSTMEGDPLCFDVTASDPDGTPPAITSSPLPSGATFTDHGNGSGTFDWTPDVTQTGLHPVTFRAFDGMLTDSETIVITVGATSTGGDPAVLPASVELAQNYPNPFNAATTIRFSLPVAAHVSLRVYDALGRDVASLLRGTQPAGWHQVDWNGRTDVGREAGSGVYFLVLTAGNERLVRSAVLLK